MPSEFKALSNEESNPRKLRPLTEEQWTYVKALREHGKNYEKLQKVFPNYTRKKIAQKLGNFKQKKIILQDPAL